MTAATPAKTDSKPTKEWLIILPPGINAQTLATQHQDEHIAAAGVPASATKTTVRATLEALLEKAG